MMHKKILIINLTKKKSEIKSFPELDKYVGGVGIGLKLLLNNIDSDPIIFSTGPLNGFFPFVSKTSVVFYGNTGVEDLYLGGSLSTRLRFTGIDAIVISGKSAEKVILDINNHEVNFRDGTSDTDDYGLPGKRSILQSVSDKYYLDNYFLAHTSLMDETLLKKNVTGIIVTGTNTYDITDTERYDELYKKILAQQDLLTVQQHTNTSCSGCPMGCKESKVGEIGGNVLVHSLVGCTFAEKIFSNIGMVFSCLNVLGYDYTHEDIEALPTLIKEVLKELS